MIGDGRAPQRPERSLLFLGALALYVSTAAPGAFWLDSGELAAAGVTLGIPHPPGHPLYLVLAYAASLLPLGPLGFRVTLLSAACAAWAAVLVYDLGRLACRAAAPDGDTGLRTRVAALVPAVIMALSQAVWLQAVRAEVYTLNLLTLLLATRLAARWALSEPAALAGPPTARASSPPGDGAATRGGDGGGPGPPLALAFLAGLACGNHHLLAVFHGPALLLLLAAGGRRAFRRLPGMIALFAAGLAIYAVLPLRAMTGPLLDWGNPETPARLWDMVTARAFQGSMAAAGASVPANLAAAAGMYLDGLGPILIVLAPIGLAQIAARRVWLAAALAVGVAGNLLTKVLMDLDPANPDAAGYFEVGLALAAICAAPALTLGRSRAAALVATAAAALVLALGATAAATAVDRVDLSRHRAPAAMDAFVLARIPPDAVLLPSHYALHFNRFYHLLVDGVRPDVIHLHQGFDDRVDGGRPHAERLRRRDERLGPVLDAFLSTGAFPADALRALSRVRPIVLEPTLGPPFEPGELAYGGGYLRLGTHGGRPGPGGRGDEAADEAAEEADLARLRAALGAEAATQTETRKTMMMLWLELAVLHLRQGAGRRAEIALDAVDGISPRNRYTDLLRPLATPLARAQALGQSAEARRLAARAVATDYSELFSGRVRVAGAPR